MKKLSSKVLGFLMSCMALQGVVKAQEGHTFDIDRISDVLSDRGVYTIIPKSAVVHVPVGLEHKVKRESGSRYVSFEQFMRRNYVWIHRMNVSVAQATGKASIDPVRMETMRKLGKVVIAVHKGDPISMNISVTEPVARVEK